MHPTRPYLSNRDVVNFAKTILASTPSPKKFGRHTKSTKEEDLKIARELAESIIHVAGLDLIKVLLGKAAKREIKNTNFSQRRTAKSFQDRLKMIRDAIVRNNDAQIGLSRKVNISGEISFPWRAKASWQTVSS